MAKVKDPAVDAQIHHGRRVKLRGTFDKHGLEVFNETQVLEFALGMVIPRNDTNPTAHRLINTFGSLSGVINAHPAKLKLIGGIGEQSAVFLAFLGQLVPYVVSREKKDEKLRTPADAIAFLSKLMKLYEREEFIVLCLDKSGKIVLREQVSGNIDKVDLDLRKIMDCVLRVNTARIVLAHNHVDGNVTPSTQDVRITRAIVNLLLPLKIDILDHIIIGKTGDVYSFAKSNLLDILKREQVEYMHSRDYEDRLDSVLW